MLKVFHSFYDVRLCIYDVIFQTFISRMNRLTGRLLRASRVITPHRNFAGIPVDDKLMGLSDDLIELRDMVRKFLEKELEPVANEIDQADNFPGLRDFWVKCGDLGLHGITSPEVRFSNYDVIDGANCDVISLYFCQI